ncbi:MAG TPA: gamma-glutamylcyclotransferase family protein [Terracidiphilus sp.]|nr:gamma-glutamylcyclotransferase family protein [Terracidiphilus sp.]
MSEYLFAYGTLQPGRAPTEIAPAVDRLQLVDKGFVRGVLYDLGDYPGAVLDPSSNRKIFGTIFKLADESGTLHQLDEYEGFDPNGPDESLFVRLLHPVNLATGGTLPCWIYVYNRKTESARVVETGVYTKTTL